MALMTIVTSFLFLITYFYQETHYVPLIKLMTLHTLCIISLILHKRHNEIGIINEEIKILKS